MRVSTFRFAISFVLVGIAVLLLWSTDAGWVERHGEGAVAAAGVTGLLLLLVAGYFLLRSAWAGLGSARLRAGIGEIARWRVPPDVWRKYLQIGIHHTGVDVPHLEGLAFTPRRDENGHDVEIICGRRSVLIDGAYFDLSPGRGVGMEEAGLVLTQPPCVAFVLARVITVQPYPRHVRTLLLLPIPDEARQRANHAIHHYVAQVESVRDIGDLARANPGKAKFLFWTVLLLSIVSAVAGFSLEWSDYPGTLPAYLGITGTMIGLGTLVIGLKVWISRPS